MGERSQVETRRILKREKTLLKRILRIDPLGITKGNSI